VILRSNGVIACKTIQRGQKCSTMCVLFFPHHIWLKRDFQLWPQCFQSKETACWFISEVIYNRTSLKWLPSFPSFVKAAKHIRHTELGFVPWYASFSLKNSFKMLCVCFIRLVGWKRCVESEKGVMEQKSLRNTGLPRLEVQHPSEHIFIPSQNMPIPSYPICSCQLIHCIL